MDIINGIKKAEKDKAPWINPTSELQLIDPETFQVFFYIIWVAWKIFNWQVVG
jgi:hypothetical protein